MFSSCFCIFNRRYVIILYFTILVEYYAATWCTFQPKLEKKNPPRENSLYSGNGIFWNFLIFPKRYIQSPDTTEFSYILGKVYSKPWHNRTFLYFRKGIFRALSYLELEAYSEPWYIQNPGITELSYFRKRIFRTLAYLELEAYSEHWHIQNLSHIENTVKHLRWKVVQK